VTWGYGEGMEIIKRVTATINLNNEEVEKMKTIVGMLSRDDIQRLCTNAKFTSDELYRFCETVWKGLP